MCDRQMALHNQQVAEYAIDEWWHCIGRKQTKIEDLLLKQELLTFCNQMCHNLEVTVISPSAQLVTMSILQ